MILKDRAAYARAVCDHSVRMVREGDGYYNDSAGLVYWFDQRTGSRNAYRLQLALRDLRSAANNRARVDRGRADGAPFRIGFRGHPLADRTVQEADEFLDWIEAGIDERETWLSTVDAGLDPQGFRHEAAHAVLFEHGIMSPLVATWLCEGMACAFEVVRRENGCVWPAVSPERLESLRDWLGKRGAIVSRGRNDPYLRTEIATALDLRELIAGNDVPRENPQYSTDYYRRYWILAFYLMECRTSELTLCLARTHMPENRGFSAEEFWIREFETVFGNDYEAMAGDLADFLIELLRRDDVRARREEQEWRAAQRR